MKNLILLLLVIGAVVNAVDLTTVTTASATTPLWTIEYVAATGTNYYGFQLTYSAGTTASTNLAITTTGNAAGNFGVVCLITDSAFTQTNGANYVGFGFSVPRTAAAITNSDSTPWGLLALTAYTTGAYATAPTYTAATIVSCPLAITNTGTSLLPIINSTTYTATWDITVSGLCGSLPPTGSTWYAKCYTVVDNIKIMSTATEASPITAGKSVTFTTTTTTCSTTTGASTFATGATILAGIAYLQF
jgi:hypothetical protein